MKIINGKVFTTSHRWNKNKIYFKELLSKIDIFLIKIAFDTFYLKKSLPAKSFYIIDKQINKLLINSLHLI